MPTRADREARQDAAVAGTFPASDPLASTAPSSTRAVPPQDMMEQPHAEIPGAVLLTRRFLDAESAKLALEALVRDGPFERSCAEIRHEGAGVELRLTAQAAQAARLRELLARG